MVDLGICACDKASNGLSPGRPLGRGVALNWSRNMNDPNGTSGDAEKPQMAVDASRRTLAMTLFGALGVSALLKGCAPGDALNDDAPYDPEPEELGQVQAALENHNSVRWFDAYGILRTWSGGTGETSVNVAVGPDVGSGGIFIWTQDDTTGDNAGTVIVPTALPRTGCWKRVYSGASDVKWFGALGSGPALRKAVSSSGAGGVVALAQGTYNADAQGGAVVLIDRAVHLRGHGGVFSAINPSLATASDDVIRVSPAVIPNPKPILEPQDPRYVMVNDPTLLGIEGLALHDPMDGKRRGRDGIRLSTLSEGQGLPKFTIRNTIIGTPSSPGGVGIYHVNAWLLNENGGLYGGLIENNAIKGGIKLENSGDSNSIVRNIVTGPNIGIDATLQSGASCLEIAANNITSDGGAIRIRAGSRFRILGNNIEHTVVGAVALNDGAVVNIKGDNGTMYGGIIAENLVSAFGDSDASVLLRVSNCRGLVVENNVFLSGSTRGASTAIVIDSDCQHVRIGPNTFNEAIATRVIDNGVGTMGVVKAGQLANGWVARSAAHHGFDFIKSADGIVHINGSIRGGTFAGGTPIIDPPLPLGFRPATIIRGSCTYEHAGALHTGEITIETNGEVRLMWVNSSTNLSFALSFAANNLGHGLSHE